MGFDTDSGTDGRVDGAAGGCGGDAAVASPKRYQSIKLSLVDALREGRWKHGEQIPSENALARRFRASAGTVRQALAELVAENVLVRQQGRGTFVASHGRDYLLTVFFPFVDRDDRKELPRGRVLGFRRTPASREVVRQLALRAGESVCVVDSLLIAPTGPLLVDRVYIPAARFPGLTRRMIAERDGTFFGCNYSPDSAYSCPERAIWIATRGLMPRLAMVCR
jgi:GntR family transcriptional regulator